MKYIQIIFTSVLLSNSCFASIDFRNEQDRQAVENEIMRAYRTVEVKTEIAEKINTLKKWQNKIQYGALNLSNSNFTDNDLPLLSILFKHNQILSLDLHNNQLTKFYGIDFSSLQCLNLAENYIISFNGSYLKKLILLNLKNNKIHIFRSNGFGNLQILYLTGNPIIKFNGNDLVGLCNLVPFTWGPNADSTEIASTYLQTSNDCIRRSIIAALRPSEVKDHRLLWCNLWQQYQEQRNAGRRRLFT